MCAYSVFNTFPVYPLSAKPLILLAFCRYRYHTSLFNRPGFQQLIDDIEIGLVSAVMVKDLSRLGRDYVSVGNYTDSYFPEHNVRFIAVNDAIDSDEGESEIAPFKNILNEMYARDISKRFVHLIGSEAVWESRYRNRLTDIRNHWKTKRNG